MVLVRETTLAEWEVLRDIRLEALQDSPDFFGSTYQDEKAITPMAWRASIARGGRSSPTCPGAPASRRAGWWAASMKSGTRSS